MSILVRMNKLITKRITWSNGQVIQENKPYTIDKDDTMHSRS